MRPDDARPSPSPAPSRWIARVGLLAAVVALVTTPAGASAGTTERVSVDSAGNEQIGGNELNCCFSGSDWVSISADGRFVAFDSLATGLVPGDTNGVSDVFVHDRQTRTTERVSVDSEGNEGNTSSSSPSITADGRFVAFVSWATNLVPGGTNRVGHVFVHDRQTGTNELVSVDSAGTEGNERSFQPAISANGRFVAFSSEATNLVPGDTNGVPDVFVYDRVARTTERVSVGSAGNQADNPSWSPSISADGRVVAFASSAMNLGPGPVYGNGIYVRDRSTGTTELLGSGTRSIGHSSISADGSVVAWEIHTSVYVRDRGTGTSETLSGCRPVISADGRLVAFASRVTTFVPGDTNGRWDVFVRDRQTGTTELASVDSAGTQGNNHSGGYDPMFDGCGSAYVDSSAISADGRVVAFLSSATNLVAGDTNGSWDVFVRDRAADPPPVADAPLRTNGQPSGTFRAGTTQATLSLTTNEDATCRYSTTPGVAYEAMTSTFATTGGTGHASPVDGLSDGGRYSFYVRCQDATGNANPDDYPIAFAVASPNAAPGPTERVSVDSAGTEANQSSAYVYESRLVISADGRFVAFDSYATNLVPGDTNGQEDVFVHDRVTGATERVSVDSAGTQGNGSSWGPAISADGRFVAFYSGATNLVPGDTNGSWDVFVHDRQTGATERVSVGIAGIEGNSHSGSPSISADGRFVAFDSSATNLVPGDTNGDLDVFVRDRLTGVTERVNNGVAVSETGRSSSPAISADGRFVAFLWRESLYAYPQVSVYDRQTLTIERVATSYSSNRPSLSADGRFVAFESENWVFVRDRTTGTTEPVSVDSAGNQGNFRSSRPAISADGRFVAFDSLATNLVPGDANGSEEDVFVHDRQTGTTERVSVNSAGNQGNFRSFRPAISADGRFVAFVSWATNLVPWDTNQAYDVFVRDRGGAQ